MVEHCQTVHNWKEVPCSSDNCNFVAYNDESAASHRVLFHSKHRTFARKKFPCNLKNCRSSFDFNAGLETHMRIHNNDLLECAFCPYRTVQGEGLKSHCRLHFKMFDFKCDYCYRLFVTTKRLNDHISQFHSEENYTCHICKKSPFSRKGLQKHIRNIHNLLTEWNDATKAFETFSRD